MNNDMVKPMPARAPAPVSWRHEYSAGFTAAPSFTASTEAATRPKRLADDEPRDDGRHQQVVAGEYVGGDDDARVGEREQRQHDVARARAGKAQ